MLNAAEQDRPDVALKRTSWRFWQAHLCPRQLGFLDETGANTNITRTGDRALRGHRVVAQVPHGHWNTTTFVGALRLTGMAAPLVVDGPMDPTTSSPTCGSTSRRRYGLATWSGKRSPARDTDSESPWGDVTLPCPEPLDAAVEVGFFGESEDGDLRPTPEHVADLTSEHALELLITLLDRLHLTSCLERDAHPETGRPLAGYKHSAAMREQLATEVTRLTDHYVACLDVYETAFGAEATEQLKACVEQMAETHRAVSVPRQSTHPEILDDPIGRAFVIGFLQGFTAGKNGEQEPEIDEIASRLQSANEDLVLAIHDRSWCNDGND